VKRYTERQMRAYEHAWEIRQAYGFRVFEGAAAAAEFDRFLRGRAWTHAEGPGALFDCAVAWMRRNIRAAQLLESRPLDLAVAGAYRVGGVVAGPDLLARFCPARKHASTS
jgi:hypothetical protein